MKGAVDYKAKQSKQKIITKSMKDSQSMSEPLPKKKLAPMGMGDDDNDMDNDDVKLDPQLLLESNGIIRGYCKGQIVEAIPDVAACKVEDTRSYSQENYTPYPSQQINFPRPNVEPVETPTEAQTK